MLDSSPLKDTKEEAAAAAGGTSRFQSGIVLGKKLYLKQSVDVEYCWYLYLCTDLVLKLVCVSMDHIGYLYIRGVR